jgi:hypothetical protein
MLHFSYDIPNGWEKLTELIIYIARRYEGNRKFGKIKLLKIIYHSDFRSFNELGNSITGIQYRKFPYGPVGTDVINAIDQDEHLAIKETVYPDFPHPQMRVVASREANMIRDLLTPKELQIVDEEILRLWQLSADDVSFQSHGIAWNSVALYAPIPYEAAFLSEPAEADLHDEAVMKALLSE